MAKKAKPVDVRAELLEATGIKVKKSESDEDLSSRVATYISEKMGEEPYEELSAASKKWFEAYCAAAEAEEDLPNMPTLDGGDEEEEKPAAKKGKKAAAKKSKKAAAEEDEEEEEEEEEEDEEEEEAEEKPVRKSKKAAAKKVAPAKKAAKGKKKAAAEEEDEEEEAEEKPARKAKKANGKAAPVAAKKGRKAKKGDDDEDDGGRTAVAPIVVTICCKNPKLSVDQVTSKLADQGYEMAESQIKKIHRNTHRVIDTLTELGWSKG